MDCCSSRTPALSSAAKKRRWEEEEEDLTKDMDDPPSEPGIQEVQIAKQGRHPQSAVGGGSYGDRRRPVYKGRRGEVSNLVCQVSHYGYLKALGRGELWRQETTDIQVEGGGVPMIRVML